MSATTLFIFLKTTIPNSEHFETLINQLNNIYTYIYILPDKVYRKQDFLSNYPCQITNNYKYSNHFVAVIKKVCPRIKSYSVAITITADNVSKKITPFDCRRFVSAFTINSKYDMIHSDNLLRILYFDKIKYMRRGSKIAKLIVFDLDETLIDENRDPLIPDLRNFISSTRACFNFVVLWSHGNSMHVRKSLYKNDLIGSFDMVISRGNDEETRCKGLGYVLRALNVKFGVNRIEYAVLVDDLRDNFTGDYDWFLNVPSNPNDVNEFYKLAFAKLYELIYNRNHIGKTLTLNSLRKDMNIVKVRGEESGSVHQ